MSLEAAVVELERDAVVELEAGLVRMLVEARTRAAEERTNSADPPMVSKRLAMESANRFRKAMATCRDGHGVSVLLSSAERVIGRTGGLDLGRLGEALGGHEGRRAMEGATFSAGPTFEQAIVACNRISITKDLMEKGLISKGVRSPEADLVIAVAEAKVEARDARQVADAKAEAKADYVKSNNAKAGAYFGLFGVGVGLAGSVYGLITALAPESGLVVAGASAVAGLAFKVREGVVTSRLGRAANNAARTADTAESVANTARLALTDPRDPTTVKKKLPNRRTWVGPTKGSTAGLHR